MIFFLYKNIVLSIEFFFSMHSPYNHTGLFVNISPQYIWTMDVGEIWMRITLGPWSGVPMVVVY